MGDSKQPASEPGRPRTVRVVAEADDFPICWICLDGPSADRPLVHPCRCPSWCHAGCIARWQLQSAGTRRETHCDFCRERLPDWKDTLTPDSDTTSAPAVMNVNFDNKTYSFTVAPGMDGYRQFTQAIRRAFHLPDDSELNITFTCDEPSSGSLLTLSGPGAYDAAVHCAAVSAARRSSSSSEAGSLPPGERAQVASGGAHPGGLCPSRVRAPRPSSTHGPVGGGASTSGGASPRSEAGEAHGSAASGAPAAAGRRRSSDTGTVGDQEPAARRSEGTMSLGRKLRNALSDMLVMR